MRVRLLSLAVLSLVFPVSIASQLVPAGTGGIERFDMLLQGLSNDFRVLIIGAHPDDEDTELLALAVRKYGADAAYLSLNRGEGGQNLIGQELGVELGLLRSRELEAARTIDGARQFFTRAYDFGFTRSLEESFRFWPRDSILKDAVRVVRSFRPHVIVSVFSGTPRDGHGQHQAAGVVARLAYDVSGDPDAFPELATEEGLRVWTPLKFYRSSRFDRESATLTDESGEVDPRTGKTISQIAMLSRSQHRSQDMGSLQVAGPSQIAVRLEDSRVSDEDTGLFGGVVATRDRVSILADSIRRNVGPATMGQAVPALVRMLGALDRDDPRVPHVSEALMIAAGVVVDAVASDAEVVRGQQFTVRTSVYNSGSWEVTLDRVSLVGGDGWGSIARRVGTPVELSGIERVNFDVVVPSSAPYTQPYFLASPLNGEMYRFDNVEPSRRSTLFDPALLRSVFTLRILGQQFEVSREASLRVQDQAYGERRFPLAVVPGVDVRLEPDLIVWPLSGQAARNVTVTLTNNTPGAASGQVSIGAGPLNASAPQRFEFAREGEAESFTFEIHLPDDAAPGEYELTARARYEGETISTGVRVVSYEHVRPSRRVVPATSRVVLADIELPMVSSVGYVRGAADRVPEALQEVGVPVTMLDNAALQHADLSQFDAIVIGSRAYETNPELQQLNQRLLDYARGGGRLLVQYQQYAFVRGEFAPFPLTIASPHDRVTDENSPVTVLAPEHPVLNAPNPINTSDWENWPQERGLYFAHEWDNAYDTVLRMEGPNGEELDGGLLISRLGDGAYVYTGISFFRSLPAGVPGAYRLFLNLLGFDPETVP